jgi:hypothetical protein
MGWATFWAIFYKLIWSPCFQVTMQQELAGYVKGDGNLKLMLIR